MRSQVKTATVVTLVILAAAATGFAWPPQEEAPRTTGQVVAESHDDEWRQLDPENTIYFELPRGRFVLELAAWSAPRHVDNIRAMVRAGMFDGGAVIRSQDNYVAQWAIAPPAEGWEPPAGIASTLPAEFGVDADGLPFTPLPDADVYAPEAGFTHGFPVGRDPERGLTWIAHCYGVVAVARGNDPDSGNGSSLAAVTGHGPRHLDRNSSMVGRVVVGMEHLTTLPRGTGGMSFYEEPVDEASIISARVGSDLPAAERARVELLRTDSASFRDFVMAYRSRTDEWFVHQTDAVDLCNVRIPTRPTGTSAPATADERAGGVAGAEQTIRAQREAFNAAIADHDAAAAVTFLDDDYQITTGAGELVQDRFGEQAVWDEIFDRAEDLIYVRTPDQVSVAADGDRGFESGAWQGSWTTSEGRTELGGRYSAHWRATDAGWRVRSELFVTLRCDGPDC